MKSALEYSIVVPIHNENNNISILDKEIKDAMSKISKIKEIKGNIRII